MTIFTYEPEKRDQYIKRRAEKGALIPEGIKVIGNWSAIGGGRVFRLVEVEDPKAVLAASFAWGDLGKIEIIPVMETGEAMKLISSK